MSDWLDLFGERRGYEAATGSLHLLRLRWIGRGHGQDPIDRVGEFNLNFRIIPGSETTILLESGGGPQLNYWGRLPDMLARQTGATVVAYDRAGVGKSDLPSTPYDVREDASMMWQALGSLGLDKHVILIGHSCGGVINRLSGRGSRCAPCGKS